MTEDVTAVTLSDLSAERAVGMEIVLAMMAATLAALAMASAVLRRQT